MQQESFVINTAGRGTIDITDEVSAIASQAGRISGLCNIFVHHTSASLIICENADPTVRDDLESFFTKLAPDSDSLYRHSSEGPDDMPAHIRSVLTQTSLTIPMIDGRLALGTWQGVFLWEHRARAHRRRLTVTVLSR